MTRSTTRRFTALLLLLAFSATATAAGTHHEVTYPPSTEPGKLQFGVTYTLWVPDDVETVRGIIVHQHGCGKGACQGGATAAYDLHWQALARKWNCALLGPSYQQGDHPNCRLWCDPRNGSGDAFLAALDDLAKKSKHSEVATAPWCLWGHSGGGFWTSLMQDEAPRTHRRHLEPIRHGLQRLGGRRDPQARNSGGRVHSAGHRQPRREGTAPRAVPSSLGRLPRHV